nr:uncharacterized protein LOC125639558 [Caretta caretta]
MFPWSMSLDRAEQCVHCSYTTVRVCPDCFQVHERYMNPSDGEGIWQHVTSRRRKGSVHLPAMQIQRTRHSTGNVEPAQITAAIMSTINTTRAIQQVMQNHNLQEKQNQARRRRLQHGDKSDEDMDIDFLQSTGPCNVHIMVSIGQVHVVECRFWARETSTEWWDRIVLQVWDDSQWLRNYRMHKGTFMELCDLVSPALKRKNTKMRAALTVEK